MKHIIAIPDDLERTLRAHLFQNELEQGAFLFVRPEENAGEFRLRAVDAYLIPPEAWHVQLEVYLEMKDAERAKVMKIARDGGYALADCHSHPDSGSEVWFSPSDQVGIAEFADYAKWKLDGKPYAAMVWGEASVDAVVWHDRFLSPYPIDEVHIAGPAVKVLVPRGTWFRKSPVWWRGKRVRSVR